MIAAIIIYNSNSGVTAWRKVFGEFLSADKLEMVSAFFSAIQGYASQFSNDILNTIDLGSMKLNFNRFKDIDADVLIVYEDIKDRTLAKLNKSIHKVMLKHKEFFKEKDWFDTQKFKNLLESDLLTVLNHNRRLIDEDSEQMEDTKQEISVYEGKQAAVYKAEQEKLVQIIKYPKTPLLVKLKAYREFEPLAKKAPILDDAVYDEIKNLKIRLLNDIKTEKTRIEHYLNELKSKINTYSTKLTSVRDVYLNLYSLSKKLTEIGNENLGKTLRKLAEQANDDNPKINELLLKILDFPDDINYYLKITNKK